MTDQYLHIHPMSAVADAHGGCPPQIPSELADRQEIDSKSNRKRRRDLRRGNHKSGISKLAEGVADSLSGGTQSSASHRSENGERIDVLHEKRNEIESLQRIDIVSEFYATEEVSSAFVGPPYGPEGENVCTIEPHLPLDDETLLSEIVSAFAPNEDLSRKAISRRNRRIRKRASEDGGVLARREVYGLLKLLEAAVPVTREEWAQVMGSYAIRFPCPSRNIDSIHAKFASVYLATMVDATAFKVVRRAERIRERMAAKAASLQLEDPSTDSSEGNDQRPESPGWKQTESSDDVSSGGNGNFYANDKQAVGDSRGRSCNGTSSEIPETNRENCPQFDDLWSSLQSEGPPERGEMHNNLQYPIDIIDLDPTQLNEQRETRKYPLDIIDLDPAQLSEQRNTREYPLDIIDLDPACLSSLSSADKNGENSAGNSHQMLNAPKSGPDAIEDFIARTKRRATLKSLEKKPEEGVKKVVEVKEERRKKKNHGGYGNENGDSELSEGSDCDFLSGDAYSYSKADFKLIKEGNLVNNKSTASRWTKRATKKVDKENKSKKEKKARKAEKEKKSDKSKEADEAKKAEMAKLGYDKKGRPISTLFGKPVSVGNKGFDMLRKMGWKEGEGLGAKSKGMVEPIAMDLRLGQCGIGGIGRKRDGDGKKAAESAGDEVEKDVGEKEKAKRNGKPRNRGRGQRESPAEVFESAIPGVDIDIVSQFYADDEAFSAAV